MITRRTIRSKKVPAPKPIITKSRVTQHSTVSEAPIPLNVLRKSELSRLHGIPEKDIFVDPGNGVELYRSQLGGWVTNPAYRGVE